MPMTPPTPLGNSLNTEVDPMFTGLGSYSALWNVDVDSLTLKKRGGLQSYITGVAGIPMGTWDFVDAAFKRWIIVATTTKIYSFNDVTLTLTDRTPVGYTASLTTPAVADTCNYVFVLTNGSGIWYWTGTGGGSTFSSMPMGSIESALSLLNYGDHLLAGNVTTSVGVQDRYKVAWSDFEDPTNWVTGDALSADFPDGNDPVMGLSKYYGNGVMFKEDSIYSIAPIQAPLFYEFTPVINTCGLLATATLKSTPIGLIFLWRNDVYVYDTITSRPIPLVQKASIRKSIFANLNATQAQASFAITDIGNNRYILFIPTSAWTQAAPVWAVYAINWRYQTATQYDYTDIPGNVSGGGDGSHIFSVGRTFAQSTYGFNVSPYRFNDMVASQVAPTPLLGGATTGVIYRLPSTPVYTDDGNAYDSYATSGLTDFSQELQTPLSFPQAKRVTRLHVLSIAQASGSLNMYLQTSNDGTTITLVGPLPESQVVPLPPGAWFDSTAVWFGFKIDDNHGTHYWEAKTITLDVETDASR